MKQGFLSLPLNLSTAEVYPFLGITSEQASSELTDLVEHYVREVSLLARPQAVWQEYEIEAVSSRQLLLKGAPLSIEGFQIVNHFRFCKRITLLAVTLGAQIDTALASLSRKKATQLLVFDAAASAAAESTIQHLDNMLTQEIKRKGFFPTARFSPGYGDWLLTWQKSFLDSVGASKIGLTVTPHHLLQPIKSVTAAIGWSNIPVKRDYDSQPRQKPCQDTNTCQHCFLSAHCPFKKL